MNLRHFAHLAGIAPMLRSVLLSEPVLRLQARRRGMRLHAAGDCLHVVSGKREIIINRAHRPYAYDMMNYFDYYHGAVMGEERAGRWAVDYSRPRTHRLAKSGVAFQFPSLPESDESTEVYLQVLNLRAGEVVFDLGAYAGASAYFIARAVGASGLVISLEPDVVNYRALSENIRTHGLDQVIAVPKGVWWETTTLAFQAESNMGSSVADITDRSTNVKEVPVLSLTDVAKLAGGRRIDAIKMDIEGAELEVLRHATEFLAAHGRPRLVIEPHLVSGRMNTEELRAILHGCSYQTRLLTQGLQNWPLILAWPAA